MLGEVQAHLRIPIAAEMDSFDLELLRETVT